jgi:hypothetical protein
VAACCAAWALAGSPGVAQELLAGGELPTDPFAVQPAIALAPLQPSSDGTLWVDPQVQPAASYYPGMEYQTGPAPVMLTQPINWISGPYLKSGVAMAMGEDILADHGAGYTFSGGYRSLMGPAFAERLFLDFGGSYLSAFGESTRITDGAVTTQTIDGPETEPEADLFASTLKEVKRAAVHASFGWYWGEPLDYRNLDPQLRIATRLGGRYGHVRGRFSDVATRTPNILERFDIAYQKTDTVGGLFVGTEAVLLARDTSIGCVAVTIDGELSNDWIEFGGWDRGSLGAASVMCGLMLSR